MNLYLQAEYQLKECSKRISDLEKLLENLPEGNLYCTKNGRYYKWLNRSCEGKYTVMPHTEVRTARNLALRRRVEAELYDLKAELYACNRYLQYHCKNCNHLKTLMDNANEEYLRLLGDSQIADFEKFTKWQNADYRKYSAYPDELRVRTLSGVFVRTKSEAIIADIMTELKVPWRYEMIHKIGDREIAPDFTALSIVRYQEKIIEFFGLMSDADYAKKCSLKMNRYLENGYIPDINLLCLFEDRDHPLDRLFARERLENFLCT